MLYYSGDDSDDENFRRVTLIDSDSDYEPKIISMPSLVIFIFYYIYIIIIMIYVKIL